jgi:hypothetical protein
MGGTRRWQMSVLWRKKTEMPVSRKDMGAMLAFLLRIKGTDVVGWKETARSTKEQRVRGRCGG